MLRCLRLRAISCVITLALCASVGATTLGPLGHVDRHGSLPAFVPHDAAAHSFREASSDAPAHPLECLVCHWARSSRPHPGTVYQLAPAVEDSLRAHPVPFFLPLAAIAAQPPLRSPPQNA